MSTYDDDAELYEDDDACSFCGDWECDGSGYNCNVEDYNLRDDGMVPPAIRDDDDDRYDEFKDGVATGLLNPDGTQREPDPPEEYEDDERMNWLPAEDGGTDDPRALPEGETHETEAPF